MKNKMRNKMRNKMSFKYKKSIQTITLFLVVCVANGYAFAFIPDGNAVGAVRPGELSAGILNASEVYSVRVNGNTAQNGMTILSGAEIKTNKNSGATIELRRLGKIEINAESSVRVNFTAEQVEVQVSSGQAQLTTLKGVRGFLNADGKTSETDPTLEVSTVGDNAAAPVPIVESGGLFNLGFWGTAAIVGGVVGGAVLAAVSAANSDDTSRSPVSRVRP